MYDADFGRKLTLCPFLVVVSDKDELDSTQEDVVSNTDLFDGETGRLARSLPGGFLDLSMSTVIDEVVGKQVEKG